MTESLHYILELQQTAAATGYFRPQPATPMDTGHLIPLCKDRPEDGFARNYLIHTICRLPEEERRILCKTRDPFILTALREAEIATDSDFGLPKNSPLAQSPLPYLRFSPRPENAAWITAFRNNLETLSQPKIPKAPPSALSGPDLSPAPVSIKDIPCNPTIPAPPLPGAEEVTIAALERLTPLHVFHDRQMRHLSSLSPIALLQKWKMDQTVDMAGDSYRLSGTQTSYGKGLTLAEARVSCVMEVAERVSSFAGATRTAITNRLAATPIRKAAFSELKDEGIAALDPNTILLEVPYEDSPIWWMPAAQITADGEHPVQVPVQAVFLFMNLPETHLFTGVGSTGLASGSSIPGARLSGLMEVVERDADTTVPFVPGACFLLETTDPKVRSLLDDYKEKGIHVFFQDITTEFGIPCYRAFVRGKDGTIAKGTGAALSGRSALLSALTETPWPYPESPETLPAPPGLAYRTLEDLPEYATGNPAADLDRVERTLIANGFPPIHVPIARRDLRIPVSRAMVPGLELIGDFDRFSTVNQRMYRRFLSLINNL